MSKNYNNYNWFNRLFLYLNIIVSIFYIEIIFVFYDFKAIVCSLDKKKYQVKKTHNNLSPQQILSVTNKALRSFKIKSCFKKALIQKNILKIYNINSLIIIGIKKDKILKSHCWISVPEYDLCSESRSIINQYKTIETI